jgi:ubiquinone/menaquinone biosynthesis C-methylase UbiE
MVAQYVDIPRGLSPYLAPDAIVHVVDGIATSPVDYSDSGTSANAKYFENPDWALGYFNACHRDFVFADRWRRAAGTWDDKVVVDIGCGPGNLFATLGGKPRALIGVDIARPALRMAQRLGYTPLLADAHDLPLTSGFADIVALNATLHHCNDMPRVLGEAARLVRRGGILICDHDPQRAAWNFKGFGKLLWYSRLPIYRLLGYAERVEQDAREASELHHRPGYGVTAELFTSVLEPRGFKVDLFPHNQTVGASVIDGEVGRSRIKYRVAQYLSGIDPNSREGALSLLCVASLK